MSVSKYVASVAKEPRGSIKVSAPKTKPSGFSSANIPIYFG